MGLLENNDNYNLDTNENIHDNINEKIDENKYGIYEKKKPLETIENIDNIFINDDTYNNNNNNIEEIKEIKEQENNTIKSNKNSVAVAVTGSVLASASNLTVNIEPPYLPSKSIIRNPRKYTLVLDLDETLVHFVEDNDSAFIQIRPGAEYFLEEMCKYYEIVIFTAAMQDVKKNIFKYFYVYLYVY